MLEKDGVFQIAREFAVSCQSEDISNEKLKPVISRVAQLVTSIPDKAQLGAPNSLSSQYPQPFVFSCSKDMIVVEVALFAS